MGGPRRRDPERWRGRRRLLGKVAEQEPLPRHVERQRLRRTPLGHGPRSLGRSPPGAGGRARITLRVEGEGGAREGGRGPAQGEGAPGRWGGRRGRGGWARLNPARCPPCTRSTAGRWGATAKRRRFEPAHKCARAYSRRPGGAAGWWRLAGRAPERSRGRKCAPEGGGGKAAAALLKAQWHGSPGGRDLVSQGRGGAMQISRGSCVGFRPSGCVNFPLESVASGTPAEIEITSRSYRLSAN